MPARDIDHDVVRAALVNDGWTVTHDPFRLRWGSKRMDVDLGAERFLGAEKGDARIAVEIKSFVGRSDVEELEGAVGEFVLYEDILQRLEPSRRLYLAFRRATFRDVFDEPLGKLLLENGRVRRLVFGEDAEAIVRWIP